MVRDPRAPNRRQDSRCLGACSVGSDTAKLVAALQGLERSHQARDGRLSGPRCQSDGYRYRSTSVAASASCGSPDLTRPHQLVRANPRLHRNHSGARTGRRGRVPEVQPAEGILGLRICDPAMGSGHFLVGLVDYLADRVIAAMAEAEATVEGYSSPLTARIDDVRRTIS